jgi:hypothetical protein
MRAAFQTYRQNRGLLLSFALTRPWLTKGEISCSFALPLGLLQHIGRVHRKAHPIRLTVVAGMSQYYGRFVLRRDHEKVNVNRPDHLAMRMRI